MSEYQGFLEVSGLIVDADSEEDAITKMIEEIIVDLRNRVIEPIVWDVS